VDPANDRVQLDTLVKAHIVLVATYSYHIGMRAVGIKILKDRLSEYVRMAEAGETVLITRGDQVVAELNPPGAGRAERLEDALLAEAVRAGWLRAPLKGSGDVPARRPVMSFAQLSAQLDQDRQDR
jgi:antitoxin (DNA-binding transcriptional repressor) of toxin-antitoxin stability system